VSEEEKSQMPMSKPRFTRSIQLGQVLNFAGTLTLIWTVSTGIANIISSQSAAMAEFRRDISRLQSDGAKYIPVIESLAKADAVQDQRIENIITAIQDMRSATASSLISITASVNSIQGDIATIKARQENPIVRR
jgi:hypothetical protein